MSLPKVVLERGNYRLVALKQTAQAESWHDMKWVMNDIEFIFEKRDKDSLGGDRWSSCTTSEGIQSLIKEEISNVFKTREASASKQLIVEKDEPKKSGVVISDKVKAKTKK